MISIGRKAAVSASKKGNTNDEIHQVPLAVPDRAGLLRLAIGVHVAS